MYHVRKHTLGCAWRWGGMGGWGGWGGGFGVRVACEHPCCEIHCRRVCLTRCCLEHCVLCLGVSNIVDHLGGDVADDGRRQTAVELADTETSAQEL